MDKIMKILRNAIKTPDGTILESNHVHDFVCHLDKNGKRYCVDGGHQYLKRAGELFDMEDISVYDDGNHETRRKYLKWGVNTSKVGKKLKQTEWAPICDLDTEHIKAIVDLTYVDEFYKEVLEAELKFRKNK